MTKDKYIEQLEDLRRRNKDQLHDAAFKWNEFANDKLSDLSRHLFTISSLLLPLSILPLTNKDLLSILTTTDIQYLTVSWTLIFSSFVLGLTHLLSEATFFKKWAEQEDKRSELYNEAILTSNPVSAYNRFKKMNDDSNRVAKLDTSPKPIFLYLQSILLVFSFLIIGFVFLSAIPTIKNQFNNMLNQVADHNTHHFNNYRFHNYYK